MSEHEAARYVRLELSPGQRKVRERQRPDLQGVGQVGGVRFLDGVAYVLRGNTLVRLFTSKQLGRVSQAAQANVDAHMERLQRVLNPPAPPPAECRPGHGGCVYDSPHGCADAFPHNFPEGADGRRPRSHWGVTKDRHLGVYR